MSKIVMIDQSGHGYVSIDRVDTCSVQELVPVSCSMPLIFLIDIYT